jgi:hypothetical protein
MFVLRIVRGAFLLARSAFVLVSCVRRGAAYSNRALARRIGMWQLARRIGMWQLARRIGMWQLARRIGMWQLARRLAV